MEIVRSRLRSLLNGALAGRRRAWMSKPLRYSSPADHKTLAQSELLLRDHVGTWFQGSRHERRFLRYAPEFVDDHAVPSGFPFIGPAVYTSPPVFVVAQNDARLLGYRTLVSGRTFHDDEILLSAEATTAYLDKLDSADTFLNEQTGLRRLAPGSPEFSITAGTRVERHIPGTTVVLCSHEPGNYGSFLFRVLPKLRTLAELGLSGAQVMAWAWPAPFRRLLDIFGIPEGRLIQHDLNSITRFDRVLVPSLRNPNALLDRESHALMQAVADQHRGAVRGRRLYISRLRHGKVSGSTRVLQNEEELVVALAKLDFAIIEPESLSSEQQIAAFESADMIVGPAGSALFNVMFCRPGTKVIDLESEPNWIYAHSGLFASCQTRYGLVIGRTDPTDERPVHRRWTVDVPALMDRISSFIRA